jgi:hypothetical protein
MRCALFLVLMALLSAPIVLVGCDRTESKTKTTTTKTKETPTEVKKTTETTERKIETNPN